MVASAIFNEHVKRCVLKKIANFNEYCYEDEMLSDNNLLNKKIED